MNTREDTPSAGGDEGADKSFGDASFIASAQHCLVSDWRSECLPILIGGAIVCAALSLSLVWLTTEKQPGFIIGWLCAASVLALSLYRLFVAETLRAVLLVALNAAVVPYGLCGVGLQKGPKKQSETGSIFSHT